MTPGETAFLAAHLKSTDVAWEWGSGSSSTWLARRVRSVTSVEHQAHYAASLIKSAPSNLSVLFIPPSSPYVEGGEDDGDLTTFKDYVECFQGRNVDVIVVDGRARTWCCRHIAETAPFGPFPGQRIFLHDCDRSQYAPIWETHLREVARVERLMLLEPRL